MPDQDKDSTRLLWSQLKKPTLSILLPALPIVLVGIVGAQLAPRENKAFFDNVHWTAAFLAAASLAWAGVRFAPGPNQVKRWFAVGLTLYAVGQVLWDIQVSAHVNPFPSFSDLFYVLLAPTYAYGILRYLRRSKVEMRTALLDVAGLTIAFLSLTLAIYIPHRHNHTPFQMAVLAAYPVGYFAATAAVLVAVFTVQLRPHVGWIVTLLALTFNTGLWLRWNVFTLDNRLTDGSLFNALFSVSALALGAGAMLLRGELAEPGAWQRTCQAIMRVLPLMVVAACAVAVVIASIVPALGEYLNVAVLPGFGLAVLLAAIRQSISLTEREVLLKAERQLRGAEERNRLILETALDAVISIGPDGVISEWNPVAETLFGYRREEALNRTVAELIVPPTLREAHERGLAAFMATGKGRILGTTFEIDAMRRDGTIFPIEISVNVIQSPQGPFFSAFIRDLTRRHEDEEARRSLEAQLRHSQKMEAVGTLAAGIAHDFNNVLAAIRGNAELAASDLAEDHPARESVDEIRQAGLRAAQLVQQIVAFTRKERSTAAVPTDLSGIAYEVARMMRSALPPTTDISVSAEPDLPSVLADPSQMHQVLVNLLTNSAHAIGAKHGRIDVNLTLERTSINDTGIVKISIRDNGSGIPSGVSERIFEPFFTTKRLGEGTGLGLSVVHNIVANHGGRIRVSSQEGVGTEMLIELPAHSSAVVEKTVPPLEAPTTTLAARLAYIDDEDSLLLLIKRSLSRKGHSVTGYLNPFEALNEILEDPDRFDIVITDLNMPEMSGIDFAIQLRQKLPALPILLTSGYVSDQILADAQDAGINRVIEKPNTLDELSSAIQEILSDLGDQRTLK